MNNIKLSNILEVLFNEFEHLNIPYCIIRNYELLPEKNIGNDIDILIHQESFNNNLNNLKEALNKINCTLEVQSRRQYVIKTVISNKFTELEVDFVTDLAWRGCRFLNPKGVLARRKKYRNFYIPNDADEFAMSLFHSLIFGGFVKEKYKKSLNERAYKYGAIIKSTLLDYFSSDVIKEIVTLTSEKSFSSLEKNCNIYRKIIFLSNIKKEPALYMKRFIKYFVLEIKIRMRFRKK